MIKDIQYPLLDVETACPCLKCSKDVYFVNPKYQMPLFKCQIRFWPKFETRKVIAKSHVTYIHFQSSISLICLDAKESIIFRSFGMVYVMSSFHFLIFRFSTVELDNDTEERWFVSFIPILQIKYSQTCLEIRKFSMRF